MERLRLDSYDSVEYRSIKKSPFTSHSLQSYGLITMARDTQRWLLVQRKHSIELVTIIKGSYNESDLDQMISNMTHEELFRLVRSLGSYQEYKDYVATIISGSKIKDRYLLLSYNKINNNVDKIRTYIIECISGHIDNIYQQDTFPDLEWSWVKGIKNKHCDTEDGIDTALREFREESGIDCHHTISSRTISYHHVSLYNVVYNTKCWVTIIDKEQDLPLPEESDNEVNSRGWYTRSQVYRLIKEELAEVFTIAIGISKSM